MSKISSFFNSKYLDKHFFIKFLPLSFIVIFISVGYYTYFIFNDTIKTIENSKISELQESVKQISNSFNLSIRKQQENIDDLIQLPGFKIALDLYEDISDIRRNSFENFIERKYENLKHQLPYMEGYYCFGVNGRKINGSENYELDFNKFIRSEEYKELQSNQEDNLWIVNREVDWVDTGSKDNISIIYKVPDKNNKKQVAYFMITMNHKILDTFYYNNDIEGISKIIILDRNNKPISKDYIGNIGFDIDKIVKDSDEKKGSQVLDVNGDKYVFVVEDIQLNQWKILIYGNKVDLTADLRDNITGHLIPIILYSLMISLIIFLESYLLLKVVTDKQTMNYKLNLTNNMNDKLRMYKHDFMNHLQVISGLIELEFYDKAHNYIINTGNEGISINKYGDIGIPELESIIYAAISKAIELEYEVDYDFIHIRDDFYVSTYDLSRILLNLTKNALYALQESSNPNKSLNIKIIEELGCYVFKISNNTPIIPEEIRKNIFNKGYSTKGNNGKGLGLYIVKKLVKKNGGIISLQVDELGNHFIVSFPVDVDIEE